MTKEDREVEIEDYVGYLDGLAAQLLPAIGGEPRVEVHGFSQGTATACRWVAFGRIRPQRLMLWCGGVPPDMPLDRYGESLTRGGLTLAFGSRDKFISPVDADREQARLAAAGLTPMTHRFDGGHRVNAELLTTLSEDP
jgi:predicted esterase